MNDSDYAGRTPPAPAAGARRPTHPGSSMGGHGPAGRWRRVPRWWWLVVVALIVNWVIASASLAPAHRASVPYTFFRSQVAAGNVTTLTAAGDKLTGTFGKPVEYPPGKGKAHITTFTSQRPAFGDDQLLPLLIAKNVTLTATPPASPPWWERVLLGFGPTLLIVGLLIWASRRAAAGMGGMGGMGGIGKSKAKRYEPDAGPRTTFADVAGIDEVEAEVAEVVDFLRHPERYRRLGAAIPKGVLLSGLPGTGKTLLARAVAGEAEVPFFSIAASEFIEMIVGVGASRVRDLFADAKAAAPAIVFIDELDAIGRARGGAVSMGGHDEREQTLNQILTEMDGFTGTEGVVVIAATNRPEILDPALLRPGRFDRRVVVNPPDQAGRRAILSVHTRTVPLGQDVGLAALAAATAGMVGADLHNLVNEAALLAARRDRDALTQADFSDALEKVVLGAARRIVLTPAERRRTAYHEAGHALLGMLTPGADPVRKISIIPRGQALGVTVQAPDSDRYSYTRAQLHGRITGALGGRAAEQLVFDDISTGAENDLEQATRLARAMAGRWGMSERIGPVSVLSAEDSTPGLLTGDPVAPATRDLLDQEVRRILEDGYANALAQLDEHRDRLDNLAHRLLEVETLDATDAYATVNLPLPHPAPLADGPAQTPPAPPPRPVPSPVP